MTFISWWKDRCSEMLSASPFKRKKMLKEIEVLDGEMQSRYEKIHGEDGLCSALIDTFNVMAELRLKAEYGDYLAYTCSALKGEGMNDMIWKIEKLDWQAVGAQIRAEETALAQRKRRGLDPIPTPYLDDVAKAADRLGYDKAMIRYQILAYAERNNYCHSGVKEMVSNGYYQELAERLVEDLRSLEMIFRERPHEQIHMRSLIKLVEKEWFVKVWVEETRKGRRVLYVLTAKANQKMLSKAAAAP